MLSVLYLVVVALVAGTASALDNGQALTPQMGWNSWNFFKCSINEQVIRDIAKAMKDTGLSQHGYQFVNIDDCWADYRDSNNRVVPDATMFPSGMYALGSYIHSLGLKFGIYSDAGTETCVGKPGSLGYEPIDGLTYAAWGVDYLKYDNCNNEGIKSVERYTPMRDALNATSKPILYSICDWQDDAASWAPPLGNSWRTTDDINTGWDTILRNLDENDAYWQVAAPGQWNDPDMLEVGNGLSFEEEKSHFSLWALIKSPLILGNDLRNMSMDTLTVLTNDEVIALNQDPLGVQGHKVYNTSDTDVWAGPLANGDVGVVLFNRGSKPADITADFATIGITTQFAGARDLWLHQIVGVFSGNYTAKQIPSHGVVTLRFTPLGSQKTATA